MHETEHIQTAAQAYLRRGWSVIPIRPADKRPLIPWRPYQDDRPSAAEVAGWFQRWPQANIAIVTGTLSGLVVLDIDPGHGGETSLEVLVKRYGPLPATLTAATGGGGRHLYFAHPGQRIANRTGLSPGLDLRGDGGYIVAPPSWHASGRPYRWQPGAGPSELAPLLTWLKPTPEPQRRGRTRAQWQTLLQEDVGPGARNARIASISGHLLWHGIAPEIALELLLSWNRTRCCPPLADEEVARTFASIQRTRARQRSSAAVIPMPTTRAVQAT